MLSHDICLDRNSNQTSFEPTNDKIEAFPVGLQILSGDATKRTPPAGGSKTNLDPSQGPIQPIKWTCPRDKNNFNPPSWPANSNGMMAGMQDPVNKGEGVGFPDVTCDGYASPLRADIHFPSCYNPQAGLKDYKNNMAFPTENNGKKDCPKGWIHTPHLFYEFYWNTPKFQGRWEEGKGTQPFVLSNGDSTGYSLHADFLAGWDTKLLQHIIDTCDAGTKGMDQCQGLFYGVNNEECSIDSPVPEKVSGLLSALPGKNLLSGWRYGSPKPGSQPTETAQQPGTQPTSPAGGNKPQPTNTAPPAQSSDAPPPAQSSGAPQTETENAEPTLTKPADEPANTCRPPKTHTVYETVTVTAGQPSSPTTTPVTKEIGGFKYTGCFKDAENRVLNGKVRPDVGSMTNEKCINRCKSLGFSVAGTEYGGQCYCGNEIVGSEKLDESSCNSTCEGDKSDTCGGSWALSVFSTGGEVDMRNSKLRRHAHEHARRHPTRHI